MSAMKDPRIAGLPNRGICSHSEREKAMYAHIFKVPLFVAAALFVICGQAFASERTVNCDEGDSLQKAVDTGAGSAAPVNINVTGYCTEDVLITRDGVSINGDGNAVIDGRVSVRGADNLLIQNLTITGSGDGISASFARIRLINVNMIGNDNHGMALRHGGYILMRDGSIAQNKGDIGLLVASGLVNLSDVDVFENAGDGIVVTRNGSLTMSEGGVNGHGNGTGIVASLNSAIELDEVHVGFNQGAGVAVSMGASAAISNSMISENADAGISVESGTLALINVETSGNRAGIEASMAKITLEDVQVVNNVERGVDVAANSALIVSGGTVSGNGGVGIIVDNGSSLAAEGVDISENASSGVGVRWNSDAEIAGCTVGNNAQGSSRRSGVFVSTSSSASFGDTEVFGSGTGIGATRQSFIELGGFTVIRDNLTDGLRLSYDSGAIIDDEVVIPPNGSSWAVFCNDTESSVENQSAGVAPISCTGFDLP